MDNDATQIMIGHQIMKINTFEKLHLKCLQKDIPNDKRIKLESKLNEIKECQSLLLELQDCVIQKKNIINDITVLLNKQLSDNQQLIATTFEKSGLIHNYQSSAEINVPKKSLESPLILPNEDLKVLKPIALKFNYMEIEVISKEEFASLPKYMVNRLTLDRINNFVEVVNKAIQWKYEILSKPKNQLKVAELKHYKDFKALETKELKESFFIIAGDIAKIQNRKTLDKVSYNFLVILRHLKRVNEVRSGKITKYIIC